MIARATLAIAAWIALAGAALAQGAGDYPAGPVKIIVPFAAGGATDVVARIFADALSARWGGKSIIVESRPGAGTVVGTNAIAKAQPDGYTLGMIVGSFSINAAVSSKLPYDSEKDFTPIGMIAMQEMALVANKSFPPNTIPELVAYAKASPQPLQFTSPGPRGAGHLAGELLKQRAGIDMEHISYTGAVPAFTDVMAGRVPMIFDVWHSAKRYVDSGDVKLIAGIGAARLKDRPEVPTVNETYPGFDIVASQALVGPAGIPRPILDKLAADTRAVVLSQDFAERTRSLGIEPRAMTPDELAAWTHNEIVRWRKIVEAAHLQME